MYYVNYVHICIMYIIMYMYVRACLFTCICTCTSPIQPARKGIQDQMGSIVSQTATVSLIASGFYTRYS